MAQMLTKGGIAFRRLYQDDIVDALNADQLRDLVVFGPLTVNTPLLASNEVIGPISLGVINLIETRRDYSCIRTDDMSDEKRVRVKLHDAARIDLY